MPPSSRHSYDNDQIKDLTRIIESLPLYLGFSESHRCPPSMPHFPRLGLVSSPKAAVTHIRPTPRSGVPPAPGFKGRDVPRREPCRGWCAHSTRAAEPRTRAAGPRTTSLKPGVLTSAGARKLEAICAMMTGAGRWARPRASVAALRPSSPPPRGTRTWLRRPPA